MKLQNARHAVFLEGPTHSDADKLQAQGRVVRLSELSPEERARRLAAVVYWEDPSSTMDDHLTATIHRKMRSIP